MISYSNIVEDINVVNKALAIKETDHILCIGSSGENALQLLLQNPSKVTFSTINPHIFFF